MNSVSYYLLVEHNICSSKIRLNVNNNIIEFTNNFAVK